jgi:hypothetical protein
MKLKVNTVKVVDGFLPTHYRYSSSSNGVTRHTYSAKSLLINGKLEDGRDVFFWTPSTVIDKVTGMLNYTRLVGTPQGWFNLIEEQPTGIENPFYFNDGRGNRSIGEVPVCVTKKSQLLPNISAGDQIDISFTVKSVCKNGAFRLNRVKLIEK